MFCFLWELKYHRNPNYIVHRNIVDFATLFQSKGREVHHDIHSSSQMAVNTHTQGDIPGINPPGSNILYQSNLLFQGLVTTTQNEVLALEGAFHTIYIPRWLRRNIATWAQVASASGLSQSGRCRGRHLPDAGHRRRRWSSSGGYSIFQVTAGRRSMVGDGLEGAAAAVGGVVSSKRRGRWFFHVVQRHDSGRGRDS